MLGAVCSSHSLPLLRLRVELSGSGGRSPGPGCVYDAPGTSPQGHLTVSEVVPPLLPYESRWTCGRRQDSAIRPRTSRRRVPGSELTVPDGSTRCNAKVTVRSETVHRHAVGQALRPRAPEITRDFGPKSEPPAGSVPVGGSRRTDEDVPGDVVGQIENHAGHGNAHRHQEIG